MRLCDDRSLREMLVLYEVLHPFNRTTLRGWAKARRLGFKLGLQQEWSGTPRTATERLDEPKRDRAKLAKQ